MMDIIMIVKKDVAMKINGMNGKCSDAIMRVVVTGMIGSSDKINAVTIR
jgi:hypothetical protein